MTPTPIHFAHSATGERMYEYVNPPASFIDALEYAARHDLPFPFYNGTYRIKSISVHQAVIPTTVNGATGQFTSLKSKAEIRVEVHAWDP